MAFGNGAQRHYALIDPHRGTVTVMFNDKAIAESSKTLMMKEVGRTIYDAVLYFPKEDVDMTLLGKVQGKVTTCPIKGDATYWDPSNGKVADYFAWSYEEPLTGVKKIEGHIAFNPSHVTFVLKP